ncbi:unnamed protein product [Hermetia illucens]|uniref:Ionotropic receptor n=1 Tax=Hermetia illucens TaxID=343691 RepID=A0A7R8UZR6_HERIL|nr:unnamed protein product [Hermetia illucens]
MHVVGLYCLCFALRQVSSSFYSDVIQEASRFSTNFAVITSNHSQVDFAINSLIHELYASGNISGFIISSPNDGAVFLQNAFKPLLVIVTMCTENLNTMIGILEASFQEFQKLKMIFIAMCPLRGENHQTILDIFSWCWTNGVVDVIIILQGEAGKMEIWTYNPFPELTPFELKHNSTYHKLFPRKLQNLMGFQVKTILPFGFGLLKYVKTGVRIVKQFIEQLNGTWVDIGFPYDVNIAQIPHYIAQHRVEFAPFRFESLTFPNTSFIRSLSNTGSCLIVPKSKSPDVYVNNARNIVIWGSVLAAFTILVKIVIESRILKPCVTEMQSIWDSMPPGKLKPFTAEHKGRLCHLKIELLFCSVGIIVVNLYIAYITSEVTTFHLDQDIKSSEDLRRSGLKIMISKNTPKSSYDFEEWHDYLLETPTETLLNHVSAFNNSFAYFIQYDHLNILMRLQEILGKPVFKDMKFCLYTMGGKGVLVWKNSPFHEVVRKFLRDILISGLIRKWRSDDALSVAFELKRTRFKNFNIFNENGKVDTYRDTRLLETNRFSADFVLFISPCSEGNFEVDSLIQELYESGNTSGFIISLSNDGATSDRIAFKPLLVVVSLCPENMNIMLFALEDSFKGFKMLKMIFIAMCPLKTETHIVKLNIFNWCWKNGVVDVIIIFQGEDGRIGGIWTYNPFPKISPFELKNNLTYQELFPGKFENVMGYAVNIMLPSASELLENVSIEPIIITQFIEKLNGSWVETTMHLPNSIQIRQADLDPVFYEVGFGPIQPIPFIPLSTSFIPSSSNTGLCLIVPKSRIRRDAYLNNARMILIWGAVVAASMLLVKFIIESRILKSWVTEMQSIRDSMAGRKLQPFTAEHRGRVCRLRMEVVLCSVGIIVINLYVAYITSEVTTFQLNQDINSIEDLRRRGLKVMIPREI